MHTEIEWVARSLGFSRVYYIDPSLEKTGYGLPAFTKTILVLAWAYVPHSIDEPIPAYYLASNSSYHAAMPLYQILGEWGRVLRGLTSR